MKTCPNCGHPLHGEAAFCQNCGAPAPRDTPPAGAPAFCSNCGEQLKPDSKFCINCGAPVQQAPDVSAQEDLATPPRAGKKKKLAAAGAIAAAAVAVVVIGVIAIPRLFSTPAQQFVAYQQDLFADRALGLLEEGVDTLGSGRFSSDLTVTATTDNPDINQYLDDSSVSLKVELNRDTLLANGELTLMGSPILTGLLSYEKGTVGFYLPEVQDTYYTLDLSQTVETLTGQEVDLSVLTLPEISGKQWRALFQSYLDVVYTVVNQENVTLEQNVSFSLPQLGGSMTGSRYTFRPRATDVEAMLRELARSLREDETLRELIVKLVNPDMLTSAFGPDVFGGYDLESQLDDAILSLADDLERSAADAGRQVEEEGFTWELYTQGSQVRMIRLSTAYSDTTVVYEAQGQESDQRQEAFYAAFSGEPQFLVTHTYTKNGSQSSGFIDVIQPYGNALRLNYDMDTEKKSALGIPQGSYQLYSEQLPVSLSLDVSQGQDGSVDHTLRLQAEPYVFDGVFTDLEVNINTTERSSAQTPDAPPYDISHYTYDEYNVLFQQLGDAVYQDLIRNLEPLINSAYGW